MFMVLYGAIRVVLCKRLPRVFISFSGFGTSDEILVLVVDILRHHARTLNIRGTQILSSTPQYR